MRTSVLVFVSLLIAGCGTSRDTTGETGDPNAELHGYESDFRPSDYDPEPAPGRPASHSPLDAPGFRVQVYSTNSIDSAKVKKAEFESLFPREWFYLDYDPPTYKIRAGNFLTKYEADRFARTLADHGHRDAWPVPQRVYKDPPAPPRRNP